MGHRSSSKHIVRLSRWYLAGDLSGIVGRDKSPPARMATAKANQHILVCPSPPPNGSETPHDADPGQVHDCATSAKALVRISFAQLVRAQMGDQWAGHLPRCVSEQQSYVRVEMVVSRVLGEAYLRLDAGALLTVVLVMQTDRLPELDYLAQSHKETGTCVQWRHLPSALALLPRRLTEGTATHSS